VPNNSIATYIVLANTYKIINNKILKLSEAKLTADKNDSNFMQYFTSCN